jgi:hypothetical protein
VITPSSQFIVSQAAVNVATGERYKEVLDSMIETALGVWGWEDAASPGWIRMSRTGSSATRMPRAWRKNTPGAGDLVAEGDIAKLRAAMA